MLLLVVCALTDPRNAPPPPGLLPLAMFFTILAIGLGLGMQTGYAINPARDLGPRILTAMVGYGKEGSPSALVYRIRWLTSYRAVFTFRHQYWLWAAVVTPIVSALGKSFLLERKLPLLTRSRLHSWDIPLRSLLLHRFRIHCEQTVSLLLYTLMR